MRAAVFHSLEDNKIVVHDDVVAVGPGPDQVRVRVRAAGVCHSDQSARTGALPQPVPAILGHEAAGEIIEVGSQVDDVFVGDRVIVNWNPACGSCDACLRHEPFYCMTHVMQAYVMPGFTLHDEPVFAMAGCGAFAEEIVVHRRGVVKMGDDIPFEVGALIGCGVMTGVGAVFNTANVKPGDAVAVIGCGGVGLAVIQAARIAGATTIVAVDLDPAKVELAMRFGATSAVLPKDFRGDFDYVFDVVASPQTLRQAFAKARRGGTIVVVGAGRGDETVEFSPFELLFEGKTIVPSMYGSAHPPRDFPKILDLYRQGRLDIDAMVTQRIRLDDLEEALGALGRGDVIRQVVIFD